MKNRPWRGSRAGLSTTMLAGALVAAGCSDQYADVGKVDLTASKQKAAELGVEKGATKPVAPRAKRGAQPAAKPDRSQER